MLILGRERDEYLLYPSIKAPTWKKGQDPTKTKAPVKVVRENRISPMSTTALHRWWYGCLQRAGVVPKGTTSGRKMHSARYTAGTEFYLATGDIRATPQLLGHEDIATTADIYVRPGEASLEAKLRGVYEPRGH